MLCHFCFLLFSILLICFSVCSVCLTFNITLAEIGSEGVLSAEISLHNLLPNCFQLIINRVIINKRVLKPVSLNILFYEKDK